MNKKRQLRRRRRQLVSLLCALAVVLTALVAILLSGGQPDTPDGTVPPTVAPTVSGSTEASRPPEPTEPSEPTEPTAAPTEPPLVYPENATPEEMLEVFMAYYALSEDDYPQVIREAFATSRENIDFLLNFPFLHDQQPEVDISGYDVSQGVPLFIQWDPMWGYHEYAGNYAGLAACGPTCLSMVAYYLTGDTKYTPVYMMEYAEANGYCGNRQGTYWSFFTEGAVKLGFVVKQLYLTEQKLINTLNEGKLIIMSVGPGHFTTAGHFVVITGYEDGYFTINDPNSYINSAQKWLYDDFEDEIKNLWSFGL